MLGAIIRQIQDILFFSSSNSSDNDNKYTDT